MQLFKNCEENMKFLQEELLRKYEINFWETASVKKFAYKSDEIKKKFVKIPKMVLRV